MDESIIKLAYLSGPQKRKGYEIPLDLDGQPVRAFLHEPEAGTWFLSHAASGRKLTQFHGSLEHAVEKSQEWLTAEAHLLGAQRIRDIMTSFGEIN